MLANEKNKVLELISLREDVQSSVFPLLKLPITPGIWVLNVTENWRKFCLKIKQNTMKQTTQRAVSRILLNSA